MADKSYRYPNEQWILGLTILLISVTMILFAGLTACLLPLILIVLVMVAFGINKSQQQILIRQGLHVSRDNAPNLYALTQECEKRLLPGEVEFFVVNARELNAYTFGIDNPKSVVLHASLLEVMDADELRFIIGHELGHDALGHTVLNSLIGGMAGIPSSTGATMVINLAFLWWNRACEYSADRAGLLACAKPQKAITALVKLVAGDIDSIAEFNHALRLIDQEDDSFLNVLANSLSTHPMAIQRIEQLRQYASSDEYKRLFTGQSHI